MLTRKFLYDLHRNHDKTLHRHNKLSANVLSQLSRLCDNYPLPYKIDADFPFHLIIYCNDTISAFCGGFDKRIDIQKLTPTGKPDNRSLEQSFMTPKGAVNYILNKWGKRKPRWNQYLEYF